MASSTTKKTTQKIAKAAPIPQSTRVNLTPTDVKNLVGALSNTKDEIKVRISFTLLPLLLSWPLWSFPARLIPPFQ